MKKRVAILYSGGMRSNALNPNYKSDNIILESTNEFLLNDEFKNKYDYDIFITTDEINVSKAKKYFGDNLKNICVTNTVWCDILKNVKITKKEWYMEKIKNKIQDYNYYHTKYLNNPNIIKYYENHIRVLIESYLIYHVYNMFMNYVEKYEVKYDYIMRIRPDVRLIQNIMSIFNLFETNKKIMFFTEHNQLYIMRYNLHPIFKWIEEYGKYYEPLVYSSFLTKEKILFIDVPHIRYYCPETQFLNSVYHTFKSLNLNFNESFVAFTYTSFNVLYRGDNIYGNINLIPRVYFPIDYKWIPYTILKIEDYV